MTFTDLFGKQYKRNPNLIDIELKFVDCDFLQNFLVSQEYTNEEWKLLVKPLCNKLSIYDTCLLQSELNFIKKALENEVMKNGSSKYSALLDIIDSHLTKEVIQLNRKKAEL